MSQTPLRRVPERHAHFEAARACRCARAGARESRTENRRSSGGLLWWPTAPTPRLPTRTGAPQPQVPREGRLGRAERPRARPWPGPVL